MFAGSSFRPMANNVRLAQTAPAPTPPVAPVAPTPGPVPVPGPVVVPIAPAPTPVVVTEQAPSYTPILLVAAIAAGIAAVVMLSKDSKGY
jgi:hypothetical protein